MNLEKTAFSPQRRRDAEQSKAWLYSAPLRLCGSDSLAIVAGKRGRQSGFTLIEILVAVSILALMGVLAYRGLDTVHYVTERLLLTSERSQGVAMALDRLLRDVASALPLLKQDAQGRRVPPLQLRATPQGDLQELRLLRQSREGLAPAWVAYEWRVAEQQLRVRLWAQGQDPDAAPSHVLLTGVTGIKVQCLDRRKDWSSQWPYRDEGLLPRLLRVTVRLQEGQSIERWVDVPAAE